MAVSFRTAARVLCAWLLIAAASCGGGGGTTPAPPDAPRAPQANTILFTQSGGSATLPDAGGIGATIELPPTSDGSTAAASVATSLAPPPGVPGALEPSSVTIPKTPIWYLTVIAPVTVTLPQVPGFTIVLPASISTGGKQFFIGVYSGATKTWTAPLLGPASISGRVLTFAPSAAPYTFTKHVTYVFELYSQPTVAPITVTPSSLALKPGADGAFTVAESGYTGTITIGACTSGAATIATLPTSAHGPSASVAVHAVASGTCSVTISDTYGQTANESIAVSQPALVVNPTSVTLHGTATGTFDVSETGYTGNFTIGTCTSSNQPIATASPSPLAGPSGTVTLTPVRVGSCSLDVSDTNGQSASVSVTVNGGALGISPAALDFAGTSGAAAAAQSVTVTETGYTGTFTATPCNAGMTTVATLAPASMLSGPSATLNVTPQNAGTCTVNVSDALSQSASFTVTVTAAVFTVN